MAVNKDNLSINNSNYYRDLPISEEPSYYTVTNEDAADPGRVALKFRHKHDIWRIILKFNKIVDPIEEMTAGTVLRIPSKADISNLKRL